MLTSLTVFSALCGFGYVMWSTLNEEATTPQPTAVQLTFTPDPSTMQRIDEAMNAHYFASRNKTRVNPLTLRFKPSKQYTNLVECSVGTIGYSPFREDIDPQYIPILTKMYKSKVTIQNNL